MKSTTKVMLAALAAAEPRAARIPAQDRATWRAAIKRHARGRQKIAKNVTTHWQD